MKTTLELPDDLMRTVRIRAASDGKKLKDVIAELLRRGLERDEAALKIVHRVQFPLVTGTRPANPGEEVTPERAAQLLLDDDIANTSE